MEQAAFVDLLRRIVVDAAARDTIAQIARQTGRGASGERKRRADWLNALSAENREQVEYAVAEAARASAFGLLCVLDGSRAIENPPKQGHLELRYVSHDGYTLIASSAPDLPTLPLHEFL